MKTGPKQVAEAFTRRNVFVLFRPGNQWNVGTNPDRQETWSSAVKPGRPRVHMKYASDLGGPL